MLKSISNNSLLVYILKKLAAYYGDSRIKKAVLTVESWFKQSSSVKRYGRFIEKGPIFQYAIIYRCLIAAMEAVDRLIDSILNVLEPYWSLSITGRLLKSYCNLDCPAFIKLVSTAATFYAVGFALAVTYKGTWSMRYFLFTILLILTSRLLNLAADKLPVWLKNSKLYQLYRYISS